MKKIHLIIFSLLTFTTCNNPKLPYCENELSLVQADSLAIIGLDFEQKESDFERQLLKELKVDSICNGSDIIGFPLHIKNGGFYKSVTAITVPVMFFNNCPEEEPNTIYHYRSLSKHLIFSINANSISLNGKILIPEKDSIIKTLEAHWVEKEVTYDDYQRFRSSFYLSPEFPSNNQFIKIVIESYIQFYLKKLDEYRLKAFGENLCAVDKETFKLWKDDFLFLTHICYTENCMLLRQSPPLPPPLFQEE